MSDLHLPRKWTLRAHGQKVVFAKRPNERAVHVWMKAFLWALYLPRYPNLKVEVPVGDRYKPDVIALGPDDEPLFWGEAGETTAVKIRSLAKRYPATHLAIAKWGTRIDPHVRIVREALKDLRRTAPVEVLGFPTNSPDLFITAEDEVTLSHNEIALVRLEPTHPAPR